MPIQIDSNMTKAEILAAIANHPEVFPAPPPARLNKAELVVWVEDVLSAHVDDRTVSSVETLPLDAPVPVVDAPIEVAPTPAPVVEEIRFGPIETSSTPGALRALRSAPTSRRRF